MEALIVFMEKIMANRKGEVIVFTFYRYDCKINQKI